ncbi:hypothetical protein SAMN04489806_1101 [Paramicrobacterium humi]|uniref:Uncharacterized protein n=1 Tax=Paramicrobacterium humi TaxID=640635 RepID=A0A1H4KBA0_9MICO|nr:hypothetical protein [Microbacterium humi]SEB55819.1 hypothetical protein SAMN04489806_1101 [Microbacterium humi]
MSTKRRLPIPTAKEQLNRQPDAPHHGTAASLALEVAKQVRQLQEDDLRGRELVARVMIHAVLSFPDSHLSDLVREPASTGDPRWDALLQGLIAWRCQSADVPVATPAWAREARLDEAWAPFGGSIRDDGWYTLSVLATPAALLHRGIVLERSNLKEL